MLSREWIPIVGFVMLLAVTSALSAWSAVPQDDVPYHLNAKYHELPEKLVEQLNREVPRPPGGRADYWCFPYTDTGGIIVDYCVCYSASACVKLKQSDECIAKLGLITNDIGVCRSNSVMESVTVG
jgi:hypothetical protein